MAAWPTLKEVRTLLRLAPDPNEDAVIQTALDAATDYGITKYNAAYAADATDVPDSGHEACLLHAARLYRRRDSIDGTISWGDAGAMRVGRVDPDVEALYGLHGWVVFG
jgi:hypothetical protein